MSDDPARPSPPPPDADMPGDAPPRPMRAPTDGKGPPGAVSTGADAAAPPAGGGAPGPVVAPLRGLVAEFAEDEPLMRALRDAHAAGWAGIEAFGPHPLPEAAPLLGARAAPVAWIAVAVGLFFAAGQYGLSWYLSLVDYPLNVGGRPPHAWPVFLPSVYIVGVLWAAAAALVGMLWLCGLPRLHHPIFNARGFARASEDRWFLFVPADAPGFDPLAAAMRLRAHGPVRVTELRA